MDEVLWHKFTQHLDLQQELLATGDAELVEVFPSAFTCMHLIPCVGLR